MRLGILTASTLLALFAHFAPGAPAPKVGGPQVTNSIGMKLVRIPAGELRMGSPAAEEDREAGEKQHAVRITRAFHMGVHEVTQGQFKRVMGFNPSYHSKDGTGRALDAWYAFRPPAGGREKVAGLDASRLPVENVSWDEAKEFCDKLSALPEEKKMGRSYRLPTEAEWEYACRGPGVYRTFHVGDTLTAKAANIDGGPGRTAEVGGYPANGLGLHDMHGNVSEWCADRAGPQYYEVSEKDDPRGPSEGLQRIVRGGSWGHSPSGCRSARRSWAQPTQRGAATGLRAVMVPSR